MMNEIIALALDLRKIKGILNVVFVGSIASFLFEIFFFDYTLLGLDDVELIYRFFIDGHFIVPFALFYFCWALTNAFALIVFQVPNALISKKFKHQITATFAFLFVSKKSKFSLENTLPESKSMRWLVNSYPAQELSDRSMKRKTTLSHEKLESDFTLVLRAFLAILIYFNTIKYFGALTFVAIVAVFAFTWGLQMIRYQLAETMPTLVRLTRRRRQN